MSRSRMEIGPSSPSMMSDVIFGNKNRAIVSVAIRQCSCLLGLQTVNMLNEQAQIRFIHLGCIETEL
jgi:hypothetical protein